MLEPNNKKCQKNEVELFLSLKSGVCYVTDDATANYPVSWYSLPVNTLDNQILAQELFRHYFTVAIHAFPWFVGMTLP